MQDCKNSTLPAPFCAVLPTLVNIQGFMPQPVVSNLMSKLPVKYFPVVVAGRVITSTWLHFKSRPLMFLMQGEATGTVHLNAGFEFKNCDLQIPL